MGSAPRQVRGVNRSRNVRRRTDDERIPVSLSRGRDRQIPRTDAADDAEMDVLVEGARRDGPYAEAKDIVGGYTLIEARDLGQAVELSKGCPILEADGTVEVRPVMKISM